MKSQSSGKSKSVFDLGTFDEGDEDQAAEYKLWLEVGRDGKWNLFKCPEDEPSAIEQIGRDLDAFGQFELILKLLEKVDPLGTLMECATEVAGQEWDSGGPGAGAGYVSVYELAGVYFFMADDGIHGPYASKQRAISDAFVDNDATGDTWGDDD